MNAARNLSGMTPDEKAAYGRELSRQLTNATNANSRARIQREIDRVGKSLAPLGVLPLGFEAKTNGNYTRIKSRLPQSVGLAPEPAPQGILDTLGNLFSFKKNNRGMVGQYTPNVPTNRSQFVPAGQMPAVNYNKPGGWFGGKSRSHRRRRHNKTKGRRKH